MSATPRHHRIETGTGESVTAIAYPAAPRDRAGVTLILGHGAGAGQTSDFMVRFADALAARGIDAVTFNFLYTEQRRRVPDRNDALEACYRRVMDAVRALDDLRDNALAIGGKSMGGRIASQIAAAGADPAALVLLGYPLHPPGKPHQLRVRHLPRITAPTLIVQGSRDSFGTPDELRPILAGLTAPTRLFVVEGGDHSFKVLKRAGVPQQTVEAEIQDEIARFLRETLGRRSAAR